MLETTVQQCSPPADWRGSGRFCSLRARMRCDGDPEALSRRRAVASLLVFAKELEKAGRISKASKGLLKGNLRITQCSTHNFASLPGGCFALQQCHAAWCRPRRCSLDCCCATQGCPEKQTLALVLKIEKKTFGSFLLLQKRECNRHT